MRILIVQDEKRLSSTIKDILLQAKYFVDIVPDGETGLDYARSGIYDGLILDGTLPIDGINLLKALRDECITTPTLILTPRNKPHTTALGEGAAYVNKPFLKEELLDGIFSLLGLHGSDTEETMSFGDVTLHLSQNNITCQDKTQSLSAREFELARLLISSQDEIVPKETIFLKIWGYDSEAESNVVEAYVSFLRRKLRQMDSSVQLVAVRRKGYRLSIKTDEAEKQGN